MAPSLYQINTRAHLHKLAGELGRPATLDDVSRQWLEEMSSKGIGAIWLLGVWQTGAAGRTIAQSSPVIRPELEKTLPDLEESDIISSPFAIQEYVIDSQIGTQSQLAQLRSDLNSLGLKLFLDFVPNHTAIDNPWASSHPEYYVQGSDADLTSGNFMRDGGDSPHIFAHGRDPNFAGWTDTLQLNYHDKRVHATMMDELMKVAEQCDGVRCDMAMLLDPSVFSRTWGDRGRTQAGPHAELECFWPAAIVHIKTTWPEFLFMAEVYWDMEWNLIEAGFDFAYDKRLYDRIVHGDGENVRLHLIADIGYQGHMVRFLENHDEPRISSALDWPRHRAAAILTYLAPGMNLFHDGQFLGQKVRLPMQLQRRPHEAAILEIGEFYDQLLEVLQMPIFDSSDWRLLECRAPDQSISPNCISYCWGTESSDVVVVVVNYSHDPAECSVDLMCEKTVPDSERQVSWGWNSSTSFDHGQLRGVALSFHLPAWGYEILTAPKSTNQPELG